MKKFAGTVGWRPIAVALAAMLLSVPIFGLVATAQGSDDHSDVEHHHGFTGPGVEADWPPRPTGSTSDLSPIDPIEGFGAPAGLQGFAADSPIAPDPAVLSALGEDWLHISSSPEMNGKDGLSPAEQTYFSRDLNQTVVALSWPTGLEVLTFAPNELQPVISQVERTEAANLGRQWLIENGFPDAADLEGFAIRALDDGELYPVRMVYVTFATGHFADPEYSTLVDLTNGVVAEGRAL